jgi:hypothetical protein
MSVHLMNGVGVLRQSPVGVISPPGKGFQEPENQETDGSSMQLAELGVCTKHSQFFGTLLHDEDIFE